MQIFTRKMIGIENTNLSDLRKTQPDATSGYSTWRGAGGEFLLALLIILGN
ncbi:MAG: hypothetical protein R6V73_03250 [Anaerolineales bacterium]